MIEFKRKIPAFASDIKDLFILYNLYINDRKNRYQKLSIIEELVLPEINPIPELVIQSED